MNSYAWFFFQIFLLNFPSTRIGSTANKLGLLSTATLTAMCSYLGLDKSAVLHRLNRFAISQLNEFWRSFFCLKLTCSLSAI